MIFITNVKWFINTSEKSLVLNVAMVTLTSIMFYMKLRLYENQILSLDIHITYLTR